MPEYRISLTVKEANLTIRKVVTLTYQEYRELDALLTQKYIKAGKD